MLQPQLDRLNQQSVQYAGDTSQYMMKAAENIQDPTLKAIYQSRASAVPMEAANMARQSTVQTMVAPAAIQQQSELQARLAQEAQLAGNGGYASQDSIEQILASLGG
jgi:hypothetical protein